jgi:hypothetical protein
MPEGTRANRALADSGPPAFPPVTALSALTPRYPHTALRRQASLPPGRPPIRRRRLSSVSLVAAILSPPFAASAEPARAGSAVAKKSPAVARASPGVFGKARQAENRGA